MLLRTMHATATIMKIIIVKIIRAIITPVLIKTSILITLIWRTIIIIRLIWSAFSPWRPPLPLGLVGA